MSYDIDEIDDMWDDFDDARDAAVEDAARYPEPAKPRNGHHDRTRQFHVGPAPAQHYPAQPQHAPYPPHHTTVGAPSQGHYDQDYPYDTRSNQRPARGTHGTSRAAHITAVLTFFLPPLALVVFVLAVNSIIKGYRGWKICCAYVVIFLPGAILTALKLAFGTIL